MRSKRILFFLCLGSLTSKIFASSNTRQLKSWTNDSLKTFISSKQVNPAERAIEHFLTKLAGPISGPIALRSTSNEKYGLQRTISEVCHVVRRNLMNFAETCGLTSTVHRYKQNSAIRNIKSNDWLPEVLLRGSLLLHDLGGITEEVTSSINRYLYRHNLSLSKNKVSNATENPRFLGTIDDLSEFSDRLCDCTKSKTRNSRNRISILSKALANLAKDSPKHTLRVLGSRLEVALANGSSNSGSSLGQLHVLFCNLVSNSSGRLNRDCITEFKDLSECLFTQKRNSTKRSNNGINNHKDFLRNHWLSGIEDISNCIAVFDDDGNANVKCKTKRRIPKDPTRRIKYVYESLLGQRLSKRSPLHRVASNLGNVLSTMPWGKQLIDETSYYLSIYQDGVKKINRLSKLQKRNEKVAAKYKRVSKSLALYKRGLLLKTLEAIDNIHRTMIEFEKIVVNGIKTAMNENWYGHLRILSCVSDWMTKLFLVYDYEKEKKNETILSTTSQPFLSIESDENSYELSDLLSDEEDDSEYEETALITTKKAMKEAADKSFEKLIRSMNRVNVRTAYEKSILVNLANNLLLTAMFMETIGFISVLFSLGNANKEEMNSFEIRDKRSQKRKRRSLIFEDNPRNRIDLSQNEDISLQMETLRKMMFMYDDKK
ncbi:uncharacterized protein LOC122627466 [Vespula pensylvanica]|uniref:uncharacterized protein LOC122627466 n=1 Tax=Vespula pensylvanica TaxID=30213 RepID=UPI001CBA3D5B|nr:uncharacterized protein LOC122627466 [Vespula pensylvanica]XP_043664512.1 uncharacterized protein LOC122627466 [Vespula pensylvanica]